MKAQKRLQRITEFVNSNCTRLPCGICNKPDWHGGDVACLAGINYLDDSEEPSRAPLRTFNSIPQAVVIPVTCSDCGRVMLFSADAIGIGKDG
jgi:hypothetical protein